jgi:hypothetical protein
MNRLIYFLIFLIPQICLGQNYKIKECFLDTVNNKKYCISADSKTFDKKFGDSYRLFLIVDNNAHDSIIKKMDLDINRSADFAYKINFDYYKEYKILIIQGCAMFYIFNMIDDKISKQIFPDYKNCEFSDGQGSYIRNLKIINSGVVLELEVVECGIHRFDIRDVDNIKEIK